MALGFSEPGYTWILQQPSSLRRTSHSQEKAITLPYGIWLALPPGILLAQLCILFNLFVVVVILFILFCFFSFLLSFLLSCILTSAEETATFVD